MPVSLNFKKLKHCFGEGYFIGWYEQTEQKRRASEGTRRTTVNQQHIASRALDKESEARAFPVFGELHKSSVPQPHFPPL